MSTIDDNCSDKSKKRKLRMEKRIISSNKYKVSVAIPVTHELKYKPDISMMKRKVETYGCLIESLL